MVSLYYAWKYNKIDYGAIIIDGKKWMFDDAYEYEQSLWDPATIKHAIDGYLEHIIKYSNLYRDTLDGWDWELDNSILLNIKTKWYEEWSSWENVDFILMDIFGKVYLIEKADLQWKAWSDVKAFLYSFVENILDCHLYSQRSLSKIMTTDKDEFLDILKAEHPFVAKEYISLLKNLQPWLLASVVKKYPSNTQKDIKNVLLLSALYSYYDHKSMFPKNSNIEELIFKEFEYIPTHTVDQTETIENMIEWMYRDKSAFAYYGKEVYTKCIRKYLGPISEYINKDIYPNLGDIIHAIQIFWENGVD